ncbi:hypothetical protein KSZ_54220 [Dictyobacter formicarum]|uniref:Uncharacterized protein n=1 Tax=Dictyobacter formicarum TaxID=2778368 RepID=A0ABQ3VPW4_9CHLR|nr:hypothetical protein KSZ_54220 [Dictyobacter formicarum]
MLSIHRFFAAKEGTIAENASCAFALEDRSYLFFLTEKETRLHDTKDLSGWRGNHCAHACGRYQGLVCY